MKLIIVLSIAALVACDYPTGDPQKPSDSYGAPTQEPVENVTPSLVPIDNGKSFYSLKNFYFGAFPPATLAPVNFLSQSSYPSFRYPFNTFNFAKSPQGILPPISQIIPPQISQIVPPQISQIVPPIFGPSTPVFPVTPSPVTPSPVNPSPVFPPQTFPGAKPLSFSTFNNFAFPSYAQSFYQYPFRYPYSFPSNFFSQNNQKLPSKPQSEVLSTSYGPPSSAPVESQAPYEPAGPAETSAPFEPSPVSFPYEPAAPESTDSAPQQQPAQEYGLPPQ